MDSTLEVCRQTHEELDRFERALYTLLSKPASSHDARLKNEHKAAQVLDRVDARVSQLNSLYDDTQARQTEIDALSSATGDLSEFYNRLKRVQEHHAKYPDSVPGGFDLEIAALLDEPENDDDEIREDPISLLFSGEEGYGKYVDLYANHNAYCNLKNIGKRPGYLQYLDILLLADTQSLHTELPKDTRLSKEYATYIKDLHTYLTSFAKRVQPLTDFEAQQQEAERDFTSQWDAGDLSEWQLSQKTDGDTASAGIWCSACQKNYSKQTVYDAHLTSKKHIKAAAKKNAGGDAASTSNGKETNQNGPASASALANLSTREQRSREAALNTHLARSILKTLAPTLNETKSNVERRFSLTAREREQELEEQRTKKTAPPASINKETGEEEEEEEEEERIYNPLKLPLGWDGKPIPYWLYKLHGLGVEYRCEICSDHVYMGRKNFDRHFQESRHAFGMRALGLPNTKHFHEITKIADALTLADKLKQEGRHEIFEQETMEELEDDEGNVYNRKTYEDLKKQGII